MLQQCYVVSLRMLANCYVWNCTPVKIQSANNRCNLQLSDYRILTHSVLKLSLPPAWRRGFYAKFNDVTYKTVFLGLVARTGEHIEVALSADKARRQFVSRWRVLNVELWNAKRGTRRLMQGETNWSLLATAPPHAVST